MTDYEEIQGSELRLLDGHLVDVQGTLLSISGELNKALYNSMLEAQAQGEKIYIYSSLPNTKILQKAGIDTEKFPLVSKELFQPNGWTETPYTIVTGKIIDDRLPEDQYMYIITTDENAYTYPNKSKYDFKRTPMSDELKADYEEQKLIRDKKNERQNRANIVDKLEKREQDFATIERREQRNIAREAYSEALTQDPNTTKRTNDFMRPLTSNEKALIHLKLRLEQKAKEKIRAKKHNITPKKANTINPFER